jgi:hypothetical protein
MNNEPELIGWDDGKIYFYDFEGKEHCINDEKKLFNDLIKKCDDYYKIFFEKKVE